MAYVEIVRKNNHQLSNDYLKVSVRERRMGTLIIWFSALILLEGVFRKWLLTPIEQPLIFIREPVLFAIYYFYLKDYGVNKNWLVPYILFSMLIVTLAILQGIYWNYPPLVPFLGIRFYLLYIPLAFIMRDVLTEVQLARVIKFLMWTAIPIGILVFLQFFSPVESSLNKGLSDDVEGRFTVVAGIVRPYGPFTFVAPQASWSAMLLSILIICWENKDKYFISRKLFAFAAIAILVMGAVSGARTYFASAIIIIALYVLAGLTSKSIGVGVKRFFSVFALLTVFLSVFIIAIPTAFESMSQRQEDAVASEGSTVGRAVGGLTDILEPFDKVPMFGYGLGAGSNAGNAVRGAAGLSLGETEWARMINELGTIFGYPILLLRILFTIWLGYLALRVNRQTSNGAALILFGFTATLLFSGQITMQNSLMAICWFAVGLVLAMSRLEGKYK